MKTIGKAVRKVRGAVRRGAKKIGLVNDKLNTSQQAYRKSLRTKIDANRSLLENAGVYAGDSGRDIIRAERKSRKANSKVTKGMETARNYASRASDYARNNKGKIAAGAAGVAALGGGAYYYKKKKAASKKRAANR